MLVRQVTGEHTYVLKPWSTDFDGRSSLYRLARGHVCLSVSDLAVFSTLNPTPAALNGPCVEAGRREVSRMLGGARSDQSNPTAAPAAPRVHTYVHQAFGSSSMSNA